MSERFTFVDLFSGIGGFRIAAESLGGKCVLSCEIDKKACKTYDANFGEYPEGDVFGIDTRDVPGHDILMGGFPCQSFSSASSMKNGFKDDRGMLFFEAGRILKAKRPSAFVLENVKNLLFHDGGNTIKTVMRFLREDLGYYVPEPEVLNATMFGLPQNRERVFIVGFRYKRHADAFSYPKGFELITLLEDILEEYPDPKYYISEKYQRCLENHLRRNEKRGNGFGYCVVRGISNTVLSSGMGKERNMVIGPDRTKNPQGLRMLTPREFARLQGFPEDFVIPVSDSQAYKQFGNAVPVPVARAVIKRAIKALSTKKRKIQ